MRKLPKIIFGSLLMLGLTFGVYDVNNTTPVMAK